MKKGLVLVCGDTHADFRELNTIMAHNEPSVVLVCGDFGYWNKSTWRKGTVGNFVDGIKPGNTKVYWCDGNHEDHNLLQQLRKEHGREKPIEVAHNVFYCPRGSTLELEDGRTVLFMGGAYSIDKAYRTPHVDWFPEEVISEEDMRHLPDTKVDIVISHTCPSFVAKNLILPHHYYGVGKVIDQSCSHLDKVFDKYNPSLWYFGHWHIQQNMYVNGAFFQCLNEMQRKGLNCVPLHKEVHDAT